MSRIPLVGNLFSSSDKTKERTEFLVMVTPHIISGEELTTGYERDFGYKLDKEDKSYEPLSSEEFRYHYKSYRDYSTLKEGNVGAVNFKPMQ